MISLLRFDTANIHYLNKYFTNPMVQKNEIFSGGGKSRFEVAESAIN